MKDMGLRRCLEILDLDMGASIEEIKQAYRDCVNVWHPDRFANNPRLKEKAERKLKEINEAHEHLTSLLAAQAGERISWSAMGGPERNSGFSTSKKNEQQDVGAHAGKGDSRTEAFAETSTRIFLNATFRVWSTFRRWLDVDGG